jgi:hypothetical protein
MSQITVLNPRAFVCQVPGCVCAKAGYGSEDAALRAQRRHVQVKHPSYARAAR